MDLPPPAGAGPESTGNENNDEHETLRDEQPCIYVADLSAYNQGILHGDWVDADQEPEELSAAVQTMLEQSPTPSAEEFAIHDYEGFGDYRVGEYDSLDSISRVANGIGEHGPAFAAWADRCRHDADELGRFEEAYLGEWSSVEKYAEQLLDDLGYLTAVDEAVPDMLRPYLHVDIEAFARDLELSGDLMVVEQPYGVYIFEGDL